MARWVCTVCGYAHEGDTPPGHCPQCMAPREKFSRIGEEERPWATEHQLGIAARGDDALRAGLKEHFLGECAEAGLYLSMARQAEREGYPEIAGAFRRIAWEEAGHAARFAEMLGEIHPDTRANLAAREGAEQAACAGKAKLASLAEAQGIFPIRDAVMEMARDEARHGCAFQGLLKRYFK